VGVVSGLDERLHAAALNEALHTVRAAVDGFTDAFHDELHGGQRNATLHWLDRVNQATIEAKRQLYVHRARWRREAKEARK